MKRNAIIIVALMIFLLAQSSQSSFASGKAESRFGIPYGKILIEAAEKHIGAKYVPLFLALVQSESNFNPIAKSPTGALGLCQILPSTAKDYGVSKKALKLPKVNANLGARYLAKWLKKTDYNINTALSCYHSGVGITLDWCGDLKQDCHALYSNGYIKKVRKAESKYKAKLCAAGFKAACK